MRLTTWCRAACLAAVALATPRDALAHPAQAQPDVEAFAEQLADHPLMTRGDVDAAVADWLDLVEQDPGNPLAEAALRLVASVYDELADSRVVAERILSWDPGPDLGPAARHRLTLLRGALTAARAPVDRLGADLYPDVLSRFRLLAPLGPEGRPWAGDEDPLLDPAFDREHPSPWGAARWRAVERSPLQSSLRLEELVRPTRGWALVAADFDVEQGGPAWLDFDLVRGGGGMQRAADGSWAWRLNEGPVRQEDMLSRPRPARTLAPVVLRTGRNRLLVRLRLDLPWDVELRLRVIDTEGWSYPGLTQPEVPAADVAPLGVVVDAVPPVDPPPDAIGFLRSLGSDRGPFGDALLGWLLILDGLDPDGLRWLERATVRRPDRPGLRGVLAQATESAWHLPSVWRRGRARELAESVLAEQPDHIVMGTFIGALLASEDRQEAAIDLHRSVTDLPEGHWRRLLALRQIYRSLGMAVEAERVLDEAYALAPHADAVLLELADHQQRVGLASDAVVTLQARVEAVGATPRALQELAARLQDVGRPQEAEAVLRELRARTGGGRYGLAELLGRLGRHDEADALWAELAAEHPGWVTPVVRRADIALARGDVAAEIALLHEAEARGAWRRNVRERLAALTGQSATESFYQRYALPAAEILAAYDGADRDDSVVRLLDEALVRVFPDGSHETLTHEIHQVRDLAGVEARGTLQPPGDVLLIRTVKPDGTVYEPVRTRNYVMPFLEPGDFIETLTRQMTPAPDDGVIRLGRWYFESLEEPFLLSRYVVSLPKGLDIRLAEERFDGVRDTIDEGDAVVHVYETRDRERVLPEPAIPPRHWFVPWIEFGTDAELGAIAAVLREELTPLTWVTPPVEEAVAEALAGVEGQEAQARALHRWVNQRLDKRAPGGSATQTLLMREGNAAILYGALLTAAGIDHDLVWARSFGADGDPDPDPPFVDRGWWRQRLLVRVRPDDGPAAWCDMDVRTQPYGRLTGEAPAAPAIVVGTGSFIRTPDWELEDRPGVAWTADIRVHADRSADVALSFRWTGGTGFAPKETFREMPEAQRPLVASQFASGAVPFLDVRSFEFPGLDTEDEPMRIEVTGHVPNLIDAEGTMPLPLPSMDLLSLFAGEGRRRLPFFLESPLIRRTHVRLTLDEGVALVDRPESVRLDFEPGAYVLEVERDPGDPSVWTIQRDLVVSPRVIEPADFEAFVRRCAQVDEWEGSRLRFDVAGTR